MISDWNASKSALSEQEVSLGGISTCFADARYRDRRCRRSGFRPRGRPCRRVRGAGIQWLQRPHCQGAPRRAFTSACRHSLTERSKPRLLPPACPSSSRSPCPSNIATAERMARQVEDRRTRHCRRLPLALSRYGRRGAGPSCRQPCNAGDRLLARPDAAAAMVVAAGPSGGQVVEQATHIDRPRAPSRRRGDRGLCAGRPLDARATRFPASTSRRPPRRLRFATRRGRQLVCDLPAGLGSSYRLQCLRRRAGDRTVRP